MLDCLLINPGNQRQLFQGLADGISAVEPPLWCRLIASYLERRGFSVAILDAEALNLNAVHTANVVTEDKPRLAIAVAHGSQPSATSQNMPAVTDFCLSLKQTVPDIPLMVIGGHPAALPELTLKETQADFVATGEGPVAIENVLELLKAAPASWRSAGKTNLRGVAYWDGDGVMRIVRGEPAANVWDLRQIPGGQWDRLPMHLYRAHNWHAMGLPSRQPYASIATSLNCPFSCSFCNISAPFNEGDRLKAKGADVNMYRMWPTDLVLKEIETLVEVYGVTNIKFTDEMFVLNYNHVKAICEGIIERGWGDKLNCWSYARIDCTEDKFLDMLRRAGMRWLCLGIEAASGDVRDSVEKDDYGIEDIKKTCERIKAAGINIIGNYICGLPSDTHESMQETLDLALELQTEWFNIYGCLTYPGAPLWNQTPEDKRNYDWRTYSHHGYEYTPAGNENLTSAEVVQFRDAAFQKYFSDPSYLSMIESKFGVKTREEIERMAAVKLKRRLLGH